MAYQGLKWWVLNGISGIEMVGIELHIKDWNDGYWMAYQGLKWWVLNGISRI